MVNLYAFKLTELGAPQIFFSSQKFLVVSLSCNDCGEPREPPEVLDEGENVSEPSDDPRPESIHESIPRPNDLLLVNLQLSSFGSFSGGIFNWNTNNKLCISEKVNILD